MTGYRLPRPARCVVIGVLNVTPDSFSDGGRFADTDDAVAHGIEMHAEGADLVEVGGESTRPGAERVEAAEEIRRIMPVITELARAAVPLSVDTSRAAVAAAAIEAGVRVVNDVSGGLADPDMARVVAESRVPWILMHWRGHSKNMARLAQYDDVVADVRRELSARIDAALSAGVDSSQLAVDPGLGFAKVAEHDWALLAQLDSVTSLGFPVLVGASRKSFLGRLLADPDDKPRPADLREDATTALSLYAADHGAWGVRVHRVRPSVDAVRVAAAISSARLVATSRTPEAAP
jgi:dihydropteroate synthase